LSPLCRVFFSLKPACLYFKAPLRILKLFGPPSCAKGYPLNDLFPPRPSIFAFIPPPCSLQFFQIFFGVRSFFFASLGHYRPPVFLPFPPSLLVFRFIPFHFLSRLGTPPLGAPIPPVHLALAVSPAHQLFFFPFLCSYCKYGPRAFLAESHIICLFVWRDLFRVLLFFVSCFQFCLRPHLEDF